MFKRVFNNGVTNFRRNPYLSLAASAIMCLTLLLFMGIYLFNHLTGEIVRSVSNRVDISAYFKTDVQEERILEVKTDLELLPEVERVDYISRQQALAEFRERHKQDPDIQESLEQLDENPLPASVNVKTGDPSQYAAIALFLDRGKYREDIENISFYQNEQAIARIERFSATLKSWGAITTLIVAAVAVLVTFNTIRLTMFNQKQEIEIKRLVGASNWNIQGPYVVEGMLYGVIAAVAALALFYPMIFYLSDKIAFFAPELDLMAFFLGRAWQSLLILTLTGALLGVASSAVAIRRYLKI